MSYSPRKTWYCAVVLGAVCLAAPLTSSLAAHLSHETMSSETIDQRIATLHSELKISQPEEVAWQAVAQTMRDNAAAIQKLATDKAADMKQGMTALDDLQTYAQFAKAHYDGLQKLIGTFQTLYEEMPDAQKKIADQVFQNSRHQEASIAK